MSSGVSVVDYYDVTATWFANTRISERDRERARIIDEITGGPHRVLELGAGFGGAAAATADLGHEVVALERSPCRASFAQRHLWAQRPGVLHVVEGDFRDVELPGSFNVVAYWMGFGVGTDHEQLMLLRRIRDWLAPGGRALLDVFDPQWWRAENGSERHGRRISRRFGFDAKRSCLVLTYWRTQHSQRREVTELLRCYSPLEMSSLVNAAGLVEVQRHGPSGECSYLVELMP